MSASLAPGPTHQAPTEGSDDGDADMADVVAGLRRSATTYRYVTATRDRDHLAALVDHYERHLTAIGRQWVIAEAHRRADTALTAHPDSEETAP